MRKKRLQLSVHDLLVDPDPRGDVRELMGGVPADPLLGTALHEILQSRWLKEIPGFRVEVPATRTLHTGDWAVIVSGRIDGLHPDGGIQEIKSSLQPKRLLKSLRAHREHPHWLQLASYRWLLGGPSNAGDRLVVVDARDFSAAGTTILDDCPWEPADFEIWLEQRAAAIIARELERRAFVARQKKIAPTLKFPFAEIRKGQQGFIDTIRQTIAAKERLLGQAPTGIGKSLGSLFPALENSLAAGTKVAFLTPKNSQFTVAEKAVTQIASAGKTRLRAITLGAKAKMCLNGEVQCDPAACSFARGHYDRVAEKGLLKSVWRKPLADMERLKATGRRHGVCPYYLSLQLIPRCDVVIADYNHAFSPDAGLRGKLAGADLEAPRPVVLIDEAHNLPDRARDLWSASLSSADARETKWDDELKSALPQNQDELDFASLSTLKQRILDDLLDADRVHPDELQLFFKISNFISLAEVAGKQSNFLVRVEEENETCSIHCLDASAAIAAKYEDFHAVVAFSATLKPLDFYRNETGLNRPVDRAIEWPSPFDPSHQKTVVIPQVSTLYRDRDRNYGKIASAILRIVMLKPGQYIAFFPSFGFLQSVARDLEGANADIEIISQQPAQGNAATNAVMELLRNPNPGRTRLLLAVQGGTFSEGIDLPGEQLIGAFVVGPALPAVSPVREKMREYFDGKYGAGFDYAYTYPAMAKSIQSAGRVIRTESDRGIVVFLDRRFLSGASLGSMPDQWLSQIHEARAGESLTDAINQFWQSSTGPCPSGDPPIL